MKKILGVFAVIIFTLFLSSCESNVYLNVDYDLEKEECTIINTSDANFTDLDVTLSLQNNNGYEKEVNVNIKSLEKGESYTFNLDDSEFNRILILSYNDHLSPQEIAFIILLSLIDIAFLVGIILSLTQ